MRFSFLFYFVFLTTLVSAQKYATRSGKTSFIGSEETFEQIKAVNIDSTLLDTFMVANLTENIRLKFIFYFQILEYASYYHLDSKIQNRILQTFKNPSIYDRPEDFSKSLIE